MAADIGAVCDDTVQNIVSSPAAKYFSFMVFRVLFTIGLILLYRNAWSQQTDGLIAVPLKDGLAVVHKVWEGETVFTIAGLYHAPPAALADINGLGYGEETIQDKTELLVPVGVYNQLTNKPADPQQARPLYYQVRPEDDLYRVSWRSNISPNKLKHWNKLKDGKTVTGAYMLVGWVSYDTAHLSPAARQHMNVSIQPPDIADSPTATTTAPAATTLEELYQKQVQDGYNLITERGTAVFFRMPVKSSSTEFYAFHNAAPKGTVLKVMNPGTGKVVYVKVLGPVPDTRQYHNAIIGISDRAKSRLGVRENKMWCELSYTGY